MRSLLSADFVKQLNHGLHNENTHHYVRQASSDRPDETTEDLNELTPSDEATEFLNELETSDEPFETEPHTPFSDENEHEWHQHTTEEALSTIPGGGDESSSESSQTILIVLGVLLVILVIICCVLACIFARLRRKGFCTVDGKNQATCDEDCEQEAMSLQQSPKESMSSGKSANSRSSDKLLTK